LKHPPPKRQLERYSDAEAKVRRTYGLGYKLHLSIDFGRMLPLASIVAPANQNEKKHSSTLLERTKQTLRKAGSKLRSIIADSQYSSKEIRKAVDEAPIPIQQIRNEVSKTY